MIGEICNRDVVIVQREEPVVIAAKLMRRHHVGTVVAELFSRRLRNPDRYPETTKGPGEDAEPLVLIGSPGRARTTDPVINSFEFMDFGGCL